MTSNNEFPDAGKRVNSTLYSYGSLADGFRTATLQSSGLVHDSFNWLSVIRNLKPADVIFLLTPVVIPVSNDPRDTTDPFECFGNALRSHDNKVRHVPYTTRNGITSTHVGMIKRATVVVFVMSESPRSLSEDAPQIHAALVTRKALTDEIPFLMILTYREQNFK